MDIPCRFLRRNYRLHNLGNKFLARLGEEEEIYQNIWSYGKESFINIKSTSFSFPPLPIEYRLYSLSRLYICEFERTERI